ncbi:hypothetical protein FSP39_000082 [Pinctada imbricata]|uniref:ATP-dependent DNA helicase n=1 Tax=Pinctada imbricata TaxID=66713 RepID=A0AA89BSS9_PINIB|nr:hypothetical protein FSP39_000082 [Pinctada imbricata]
MPILAIFYDLRIYKPCYVTGVTQQTDPSCGAYACAFAVACANHTPPECISFGKDLDMRSHLHKCINSKNIQSFPILDSLKIQLATTNNQHMLLLKEFENQQRLQTAHLKEVKKTTQKRKINNPLIFDNSCRYLDRKRKTMTDIRTEEDEKEREVKLEKDRRRQAEKRAQESDNERRQRLERARNKMQFLRQNGDTTSKLKRQQKDKMKRAENRSNENEDEKAQRLDRMRNKMESLRKNEKDESKHRRQQQDRSKHAEKRLNENEDEKAQRLDRMRNKMESLRKNEKDESKHRRQQQDRSKHAEKRLNEAEDEKAQRLDRMRNKMESLRKNEKDESKHRRQQQDRSKHAEKRLNENEDEKAQRLDRMRNKMESLRKNEKDESKHRRQQQDRSKHAEKRLNENEDEKAQRLDRMRNKMESLRKNEKDESKHRRQQQDRSKHTEKCLNETEDEKAQRLDRMRNKMESLRKNEKDESKHRRQQQDRSKHAEKRLNETEDERTQRLETIRNKMKCLRRAETEHHTSLRQQADRQRHHQCRNQQSLREKEKTQRADRRRKNMSRKPESIENARKLFIRELLKCPEYVCTVCHRLLYKESVVRLKPETFKDRELLQSCRTYVTGPKKVEWICKTCKRHLIKSKMPPQAQANKMEVFIGNNILNELTDFESRLLAKRIPFMKITALPRGRQRGIIGPVINVPSDIDRTCDNLPRTPKSSGIIPVKLKRKQAFKNHVFYENVRPQKVLDALKWLKENNKHYQEVVDVSDHWVDDSRIEDDELWEHLTKSQTSPDDQQQSDKDDLDKETDNDEQEGLDEDSDPKDCPLDTCIQSSDPALDVSQIMTFAPGEGKTPINVMMDTGCEEMAFPKLFPKGGFGFDAARTVKLTPKKYFNARILNRTGEFARNIEYLFFAQYISEHKQIMDNISIAMRKSFSQTSSGSIDSSYLKDNDNLTGLILKDHAYQFLQTVRGSPPYWQKAMYKLLAAVKQLGIFTFFVTLSSADMKWRDTLQAISRQQGNPLSDEEVDNLSFEEKSNLLRSNPVTAAQHFDYRLQKFFTSFLLSPAQPLGKIKHYSYRIEFQQRGSPHAHIVIWTDSAPTLEDGHDVVTDFIDQYVTCQIPNKEDDPDLHRLVTTLQQHQHSATCKKKGTFCRFNFPKLPSNRTIIAHEIESDDPIKIKQLKQQNMDTLSKVHEILSQKETLPTTVESLTTAAGVSLDEYEQALEMSKYGKTVVLQRTPQEININYYNPDLLRTWCANLDVQYCLDPYACITYMVAYITKDEREMGNILHSISQEAASESWSTKMRKCARAFLNARELSAQEAVYRLMSFPLFKCSFRTVFVPADLPQNRVRLLKPLSRIQEMDDGDEDIFQKNIIDRYSVRPDVLNNFCLAKFAIWYCPIYDTNTDNEQNTDGEENDTSENTKVIELLDGSGKMKKTALPGVLRYPKKSKIKEPDSFFYGQILLYKSWRNEQQLLTVPSFEEFFNANLQEIDANRGDLEHYSCIVENAFEQLQENGPPVHIYDDISPNTRQENLECIDEGHIPDPDSVVLQPDQEHTSNGLNLDVRSQKPVSYSIEQRPSILEESDFFAHVRSLNGQQRTVYQYVENWSTLISRQHKTGTPIQPIHLFVSGGAGTGKSHLISALYQMAQRKLYHEGENPDDVKVLLSAPTGTAAHNISGTTLHSAFLLPLGQAKSYIKLSDDKRNALRTKAGTLKMLIIDEISMVGSDILLQIHYRLCEIKSSSEPFGGISVIVFGDLYQLPPVMQQFVFKPVSDPYVNLYGSLWRQFLLVELKQIMRQNEDLQFANVLNRIRTATHTEEDIELLKTREISKDSHDYPSSALHVFSTNKCVNEYNEDMLQKLQTKHEVLSAVDKKPEALKTYDVSQDSRFTGGLPSQITLAIGAKVMLIRNIDISDGLVNGAQGVVVAFLRRQSEIEVVFVEFQGSEIGKSTRLKSKHVTQQRQFPKATPIERTEISFTVNKNNKGLTISRSQFPLKLCWACTVHKVQGLTVSEIVVSFKNRFTDGQAYVALSRAKTLNGLHIMNFQASKIRTNKEVLQEMQHLTENKLFRNDQFEPTSQDHLVISTLNTRSLVKHLADVFGDPVFKMSDIVILTETWLSSDINTETIFPIDYDVYRKDKPQMSPTRQAGGVAVIIKKSFEHELIHSYTDAHLQVLAVTVSSSTIASLNVIGLYNSPNPANNIKSTTGKICTILDTMEASNANKTIILGDINENFLTENVTTFVSSLQRRGYHQAVKVPTHRSGSCLDHIYMKDDTMVKVNSCYYSDHDWVSCKIKL